MTKAYAFYDIGKRISRIKEIRVKAAEFKLKPVSVQKPDFIDALTAVMAAGRDSKKNQAKQLPALIGFMIDIKPPDDAEISEDIWRECVLCYLEQEGIAFYPLDNQSCTTADLESNVIRKYIKALNLLADIIRTRLNTNGKKFGRPPYGYCMDGGILKVDNLRAPAIKLIFQRLREGVIPRDIINELRTEFRKFDDRKKNEFWDHGKLRRIVEKARLYCLGEYTASDGAQMTFTRLAFLPPEWADTKWPIHQGVTS